MCEGHGGVTDGKPPKDEEYVAQPTPQVAGTVALDRETALGQQRQLAAGREEHLAWCSSLELSCPIRLLG